MNTGDVLAAQYEYQLSRLPAGQTVQVSIPTASAAFHLSSGSALSLTFLHRNVSVAHGGWSPPVSTNRTLSSPITFSPKNADLSSGWLAVTTASPYGTVQIQFQWRWVVQQNGQGGKTQTGPWSHSVNTGNTTQQPTTFYAAPWVHAFAASGTRQPAGSNYTLDLQGNVSGTIFKLIVETATGTELNTKCLATPSGAGTFNATLPLTYSNGTPLRPGSYVVHIKDAGSAIVVFARITVY
ncbi:MAG TPA: hypothetical protein VGV89_00645 [Thermoplasmata archaeon]|nr:hypothetical protein [Thermoplasmata archaeon]